MVHSFPAHACLVLFDRGTSVACALGYYYAPPQIVKSDLRDMMTNEFICRCQWWIVMIVSILFAVHIKYYQLIL